MVFSIFKWWHSQKRGRALLKDVAVNRHRDQARKLIDMLYAPTPLLGINRIQHEFYDYYVDPRRPVGTWRVTVECIEEPPKGEIVEFKKRYP